MSTLLSALEPLLDLDPVRWGGLPDATVAQFDALFGPPDERIDTVLGVYPASRTRYRHDGAAKGLLMWAREGIAVMVQTVKPPDQAVLGELPEPDAVLAHEILVPVAYAHEYLYCATGLVLTVARAFRGGMPDRIVRCRGIKRLDRVEAFGPAYYQAFEDRIQWAGLDAGVEPT